MADFAFYQDTYHGNLITAADFPRLSARAEDILAFLERDYTVTGDTEARDKAICALAEAVQATEKAASAALSGLTGDDGAVVSKSIGSVSVSYRQTTTADAGLDLSERVTQRRYYDIARRYLTIFRGVC